MNHESGHDALRRLYEQVDREVAAAGPTCHLSGRCCDFPRSGHVLFASALETDLVRAHHEPPVAEQPGWCPFYRARLCTLRELRPLGCRLYFCDADYAANHMEAISDRAHRRLRKIHDDHDIDYRYAPFVDQLDPGGSA